MADSLKDRVSADTKTAMKSGDKQSLSALRLILAAIKQHEVDNRSDLDDDAASELLTRMAKQRRDSIKQYTDGNREDLAEVERFELALIEQYLPEQMSADEIAAEVAEAIAQCGAESARDMGKVMGILSGKLKGKADMSAVSKAVKSSLAG